MNPTGFQAALPRINRRMEVRRCSWHLPRTSADYARILNLLEGIEKAGQYHRNYRKNDHQPITHVRSP